MKLCPFKCLLICTENCASVSISTNQKFWNLKSLGMFCQSANNFPWKWLWRNDIFQFRSFDYLTRNSNSANVVVHLSGNGMILHELWFEKNSKMQHENFSLIATSVVTICIAATYSQKHSLHIQVRTLKRFWKDRTRDSRLLFYSVGSLGAYIVHPCTDFISDSQICSHGAFTRCLDNHCGSCAAYGGPFFVTTLLISFISQEIPEGRGNRLTI